MRTKRSALVLGDESARHPFLASLRPHVRNVDAGDLRERTQRSVWRDFLAAYCVSLVVISIYIA